MKSTRLFFCILIFLLHSLTVFSNERIEYTAITVDEKTGFSWTIEDIDKKKSMLTVDNDDTVIISNFLNRNTVSIEQYDQDTDKKIVEVQRFKNRLKAKYYKGKKIKRKSYKLLNINWFQFPGYCLKPFVLSDKKSIKFCRYDFINKGVIELVATKVSVDRFKINNKNIDVRVVKIHPPGVLSLFWSTYMWFDMNTGRMVMFDGSLTGPSGKKTIIKYKSHNVLSKKGSSN